MGQAILIASGKGGTGKTSVTAGIGAALAAQGKRVLLLDCDIGMRNLDLILGLTSETPLDFFDVLMHDSMLGDAIAVHPQIPTLHLLNCPGSIQTEIPTDKMLAQLKQKLMKRYDWLLIDAPAGLGTGFRIGTKLADSAIVVTTPDKTAYRDASITARMLSTLGLKSKLIINRVLPREILRGDAQDLDLGIDTVGIALLGVVPEDPQVRASGNRSVVQTKVRRASAAKAFVNIAARLEGKNVPLMRLRMGARH